MRSLLILLPLVMLSPPAAAQQVFAMPAGCEAYVTVQSAACTVSHHFTCVGDPEGHQRRVDMDEGGMTYIGSIDAETQWIASFHTITGHSEVLEPAPVDRASLTELIETGVNTYDFMTLSDEVGPQRYVGTDRLTGVSVEIDGVMLDQTSYEIRSLAADGTEIWRAAGNEYISREWRMFLAGVGTVTTPDGSFDSDDSPVEFMFAGEPGFLSANPKHGCGVVMSSYAPGG